jgi:TonB family protein
MQRTAAVLFIALASTPLSAHAQPVSEPAASAPRPVVQVARVRPVSIRPSDPIYLESLHTQGIQGTVEILARVGSDGFPVEVSVQKSSRSSELDELGLKVVKDLRFGAGGAGNTQPLPPILVPVEFLRDSVTTLSKKTCRELNVDVDYQKRTFPESNPQDMPVIKMTVGALFIASAQRATGDQLVAASRRTTAAAKEIIGACSSNPDANYLQTFRELVAKQ